MVAPQEVIEAPKVEQPKVEAPKVEQPVATPVTKELIEIKA